MHMSKDFWVTLRRAILMLVDYWDRQHEVGKYKP
jgi:hypothetical protein